MPIMLDELQAGKRRVLAQTLTLLESNHPDARQQALELLRCIGNAKQLPQNRRGCRGLYARTFPLTCSTHPETDKSLDAMCERPISQTHHTLRLGITGSTGAGKSTLVQALGKRLCQRNPVAVLAVDPTSPQTGGSILGDKVRMQEFTNKQNVYVRPLPSSIPTARLADMIKVCEYAGFPLTIVETVGAGQTEYQVRNIVDVLINIVSPNSGDAVQCMKKGLHELTDIFVINRHDGNSRQEAKRLGSNLSMVLNLSATSVPPVLLVSALGATGIDALEQAIDQRRCDFTAKRLEQEYALLQSELQRLLANKLPTLVPKLRETEELVRTGKLSATLAAEEILAQMPMALEPS